MTELPGRFQLRPEMRILLDAAYPAGLLETALVLQREAAAASGIRPALGRAFTGRTEPYGIVLTMAGGPPESYTLSIEPAAVLIAGADAAGLFYGVQTLRQLFRLEGGELACRKIADYPAFRYRGFMHDVTRGKVPTLATLKELADRMAFYKLNQLQLYIEHSFAFGSQSEVWMGQDPLTAEEILRLDAYCRERHIELVPCLSTFGHLYQVLRTQSFAELNELPGDGRDYSWIDRQHHHTLDVSNPGSIAFVKGMIDEFLPLFTSDKFNICCDETFDLGEGKNRELAAKVGKGRLYVDFLKQIIAHVQSYGKQVLFWGDIILNHAELLPELPPEVVALNWNYSAEATPEGTRTFAAHRIPQYVCPAVDAWDRLIANLEGSFRNIAKMAGYGREYQALGVLNTDWGDHGHIQPLAASIPGMIYGAAFSWNPAEPGTQPELGAAIARIEFGDATGQLLEILDDISRKAPVTWCDIDLWYERRCGQTWGEAMLRQTIAGWTERALAEGYAAAQRGAERIAALTGRVPDERQLDLRELQMAARGTALFQALGIWIKSAEEGRPPEQAILSPGALAAAFENWFGEYAELWRARNKESELYRIREFLAGICRVLRGGDLAPQQD
jgi:hypothetical protein